MPKRTITIRGVPDGTVETLRARAAENHRSLNGELLAILDQAAEIPAPARVREAGTVGYQARPVERRTFVVVDREELDRVCRQHHIQSLALFGSHARGEGGPDSDLDLLVEFAQGKTPGLGLETVAAALADVLGGGRKVDLVTRRGLRSPFLERVLAEAVPLYHNGD